MHCEEIMEAEAALRDAGVAANTRTAYASDMRYFRVWHRVRFAADLPLPTPEHHVVAFVVDHCGAMPPAVETALMAAGVKTKEGPHRYSTIRRRLAALGSAHLTVGHPDPTASARVRTLLRRARTATRDAARQKKRPLLVGDVQAIAQACDGSPRGRRDRALVLVGFFAGGRRRSELAKMRVEDVFETSDGYLIRLDATKAASARAHVPVLGPAAEALAHWLALLPDNGPLFRRISRSGVIGPGLSPAWVNDVLKKRATAAGFDPATVSAHGLRAGFITACGREGIAMGDAMALSRHASLNVVLTHYYQAGRSLRNPAAYVGGSANRASAGQPLPQKGGARGFHSAAGADINGDR